MCVCVCVCVWLQMTLENLQQCGSTNMETEKKEMAPTWDTLSFRSHRSYGTSKGFGIKKNCVQRQLCIMGAVLLPGKSHGWRSLVGCSPWGRWGSDTTERLHFHFSLSCIGVGNSNPLQCSCLENPRDGGAWWAAVCGVAQSRTWLKWLSSSSSSSSRNKLFNFLPWFLHP